MISLTGLKLKDTIGKKELLFLGKMLFSTLNDEISIFMKFNMRTSALKLPLLAYLDYSAVGSIPTTVEFIFKSDLWVLFGCCSYLKLVEERSKVEPARLFK